MSTGGSVYVGGLSTDIKVDIGTTEVAIDRVKQRIQALEGEFDKLADRLKSGAIGFREFAAQNGNLVKSQLQLIKFEQELQDKLQGLKVGLDLASEAARKNAAATKQVGDGVDQTNKRAGAFARGLMQVGYVVDDVQYGFNGIVNNISPLVYSFSAAAGASSAMASSIAAGAQVVAVGIYQAYVHWDLLMDSLGQGIPTPALEGLDGLKNELKEVEKVIDDLHDKERLNLIDAENLKDQENQAKALKDAIKDEKTLEGMDGPTKEEKSRGSAFEDGVKEQGRGEVEDLLKEHYTSQAEAEGQTLERGQIKEMLKAQGIDLTKELDLGQLETLEKTTGVKFDSEAMQRRSDQSKGALDFMLPGYANALDDKDSLSSQVLDQLSSKKYIYDELGNARTAESMARDTLLRGADGNKDAAELVGAVTNQATGDPDGFTDSAFSKTYNESSPEGKEADKLLKEKEKAFDKEAKKDAAQAKKEADKLDDELDAAQQAFDDSNTNWKKYRERREKWIKEQVDALKGGDLGQAAIAGTLTEDQVKERLTKMGLDEGKVNSAYEEVYSKLELAGGKAIAGRVGETGESRDVAAENLAREDREKRRNEAAKLAEKVIPGLDKAVEQRLTVGSAMTGDGFGVAAGLKEQIRKMLIDAGVNPDAAANQASAAVDQGGEKVNRKIAEEAMDQQSQDKQSRKVDVFDSASLASKLQSSVGDTEQKKQTDLMTKSTEYLAKLANQSGTTIRFGPGGSKA